MKATTLLERQHRKVEAIFKKLESGRAKAEPLVIELATDLLAHMAIEQDIFYPAIKAVDEDLVLESFEEHAVAQVALKRLVEADPDDKAFKAKVIVLKELIQHHVEEEEEELFPKVEKALGEEKLVFLGKQMKAAFDEAVEAGYEGALPKGKTTSADRAEKKVVRSLNGAH